MESLKVKTTQNANKLRNQKRKKSLRYRKDLHRDIFKSKIHYKKSATFVTLTINIKISLLTDLRMDRLVLQMLLILLFLQKVFQPFQLSFRDDV